MSVNSFDHAGGCAMIVSYLTIGGFMSNVTRRSFFQGAALAASATRVMGANDRISMGIVGLGGRGTAHLGYYISIPDARIAALCDVNQAARERSNARLLRETSSKGKE